MAAQTPGIQKLLAAEAKAGQEVEEARKRKNARLRQAKLEANAEIGNFKLEREKQYKELEQKHLGSRESIQQAIDQVMNKQIGTIEGKVHKSKGTVVDKIVELVMDVNPVMHTNASNDVAG